MQEFLRWRPKDMTFVWLHTVAILYDYFTEPSPFSSSSIYLRSDQHVRDILKVMHKSYVTLNVSSRL